MKKLARCCVWYSLFMVLIEDADVLGVDDNGLGTGVGADHLEVDVDSVDGRV